MSGSISTRAGDDGTTSLLYGQRVPKDHAQVEALGACDELNVALGLARAAAACDGAAMNDAANAILLPIQRDLVALMGELACAEADAERYLSSPFPKLEARALDRIDAAVVALEARGLRFDGWATPGATSLSAAYDHARVIARRAERRVVGLPEACGRHPPPLLLRYLNRVSDLLWLLAREAEQTSQPPNT